MAKVGLEYARIAKLNDSADLPSYSDCIKLGAAVKFDCKINLSKAVLYADNKLQESRAKFKDGTLSVDIDDLLDEARTLMLDHAVDETTSEVISNADARSPYVGFGIVGTVERGGVTKHRAIWFCKVQFEEPSESGETEGETFKYDTTSVSGTIYALKSGDYKYDKQNTSYQKQIEEVTEVFETGTESVDVVFGATLRTVIDLIKGVKR